MRKDAQLDVVPELGPRLSFERRAGRVREPFGDAARSRGRRGGRHACAALDWLDFAAAGWLLDLDHETTWSGDEGTTGVSDATRRAGVELETRYELAPWRSKCGHLDELEVRSGGSRERRGFALAPKQTWSNENRGRSSHRLRAARTCVRWASQMRLDLGAELMRAVDAAPFRRVGRCQLCCRLRTRTSVSASANVEPQPTSRG